ncbi:hypothetical protein OKA05_03585 [Luteolibacter arcticus]|uniref:LamG-like jellyroll fold domain-containing protein n=1 Tax=Luteolibacter arcticus TaxID=1581411 RepID=A0ABT3GDI9_9BACT|nr:LamG domain-containing protein [Luteolibacter arcticus]MCW1921619.1 hypothetical protein [Luteolibacter arcticus]
MKSQANPLVAVVLSTGMLWPLTQAAVTPYSGSEANTAFLFHLDDTSGSVAANSASGAAASKLQALTVDGNPLSGTGAATNVTTLWGGVAFPGFGTAANLSGADDLGLPIDVTGPSAVPDGTFVASGGTNADTISLSSIMGTDSAFTIEALVNIPNLTTASRSIAQTDSSNGNDTRGFQFRISNGNVELNSIGLFSNNGTGATTFAIPTTGANAFVANEWFHIALVYTNASGAESSTIYWTRVNAATEQASVLGTTGNEGVDPAWVSPLVIGNEGRNTGSGVNMWEGLRGLIDEVRISKVARTPTQFIFTPNGDTDGDELLDSWELIHFRENESETVVQVLAKQGKTGNPDGDSADNFTEQNAGSDPNNAQSIPGDIDGDGLGDPWEITHFGVITAQDGNGDPDNDYAYNEDEETAGTDPSGTDGSTSFPDSEPDGLSDGWELFRFDDLDEIANGDPDHDLYTNAEEYTAGTDPTQQLSALDSDTDGLNDGWEALYFHLTGESRATTLAKQTGTGDPDGDHYSNEEEEAASTNPTTAQKPSDTDADGLLDSWEQFHFTNLDETGTGNTDGDSANHSAEQAAGSNPTLASSTPADIDGDGTLDTEEAFHPYTADSNTLHLWHLDEVDQAAADAGSGALSMAALNANGRLWAPSLAGFATGLDPSPGRGTLTGGALAAKPLVNGTSDNATLTYAGVDGAFTFEAIVRIDFDPAVAPATVNPMQILTGEADEAASRVWQFRLVPVGGAGNTAGTAPLLEFINLHAETAIQSLSVALPISSDPDAIAQGGWYHVAVAYNGTEATADNFKFYWTLLDSTRTQANEVFSGQMTSDLITATPDFTIGNEGRDFGSGVGSTDSFLGVVDEVRISDIARTPAQFLFAGGDDDSDNDDLPDSWETTYFDGLAEIATGDFEHDGTDNLTEYRLGLIPNGGSSRFAATRTSGGAIQWPSVTGVTFKIERSINLSGWSTLEAAFAGTAGTASYTDPEPPAGKAFYKITLNP